MRWRLLMLAAVVATAIAVYAGGAWEFVADPRELRRMVIEAGSWGSVLFVLAFIVLEAFGVPGILFILTATLIWPRGEAVALSLVGALGAAVLGFFLARGLAREWIERRLPTAMRAWDARLASKGFSTVLALRIVFYCAPWTNWLFGMSQVRFAPFFAATVITYIPWTIFWVYGGRAGWDWLVGQSFEVWLGLAAVIVAFLVIRRLRQAPVELENPPG